MREILATGYVVDTLEAVLWAFHRTGDFRGGSHRVVNLGDDADTTGAVYGQFAGAFYGVEDISVEWRRRLAMGSEIESLADSLFERGGRFMARCRPPGCDRPRGLPCYLSPPFPFSPPFGG